jgi:hypothetical protein
VKTGFSVDIPVLDISLAAFIPEDNVPTFCYPEGFILFPFECGWTTGEGDGRGFSYMGPARAWQFITLYSPRSLGPIVTDYVPGVNPSALYEMASSLLNGRLTFAARNDFIPGPPLKTRWAQGVPSSGMTCFGAKIDVRQARLTCEGDESTPLFWFAPAINWRIVIDFTFGNTIRYRVSGMHDGYPNYELYIGTHRIFEFDHIAYNETIYSLGLGMERFAYGEGTVP